MSLAGERIKECRTINHLTQDDVAQYLGIGKQAIYKYEIGAVTNIPLENIVKMATLFRTTPSYLAGWSDEGAPVEELTENECRLVALYRTAEPYAQKIAIETLQNNQIKNTDQSVI